MFNPLLKAQWCNFFHAETLRKYPPGTLLQRQCTKSTKIRGTDVTVEKGTQILVPILGLHHDPKFYPDPERFDPERFSEAEKKKRPHFCYLPFGEGPRICIGKCHLTSLSESCGPVRIVTILWDGRLSNRGLIPGKSKKLSCSARDQHCSGIHTYYNLTEVLLLG